MSRKSGEPKPRVGISACLLGECVRYDGGHKRDDYLVSLRERVEWVAVCPEVECGLGVPREAMHLTGEARSPRLVTVRTGVDLTQKMAGWIERRLGELEREGLRGFVFKSRSPSCGLRDVVVTDASGSASGAGAGLFARALVKHFPGIPVEEETNLRRMQVRDQFFRHIGKRGHSALFPGDAF